MVPWDWSLKVLHDTEIKARIHGVQAIMQAFDIIFCCFTAFNHMDDLSDKNNVMLQKAAVLTAEGYVFAHEALFDFFYSHIFQIAGKISSLSTRSECKW